MKLDANAVAALSLGGKSDVIYFDSDLPGLGTGFGLVPVVA
jgi:hypothetical protein